MRSIAIPKLLLPKITSAGNMAQAHEAQSLQEVLTAHDGERSAPEAPHLPQPFKIRSRLTLMRKKVSI